MTKTEILQRWYDEVWHRGNLDVIGEMLMPDTKVLGSVAVLEGRNCEYRDLVGALRNLFMSVEVRIRQTVESGDWLAAHLDADCARASDGEWIAFSGQVMVRFEGEKFAEFHSHFDYLTMFEKLGQMPRDVFAVCTTGHGLIWR
ncbi:nuclear transport factor 2 family protein [Roseobacteraceae bacterium NS-SX3]